jgi:hypothetical protein
VAKLSKEWGRFRPPHFSMLLLTVPRRADADGGEAMKPFIATGETFFNPPSNAFCPKQTKLFSGFEGLSSLGMQGFWEVLGILTLTFTDKRAILPLDKLEKGMDQTRASFVDFQKGKYEWQRKVTAWSAERSLLG